jgi:hypothetical protein
MGNSPIVPRWEWRCFAPSFGTLEQAIALPSEIVPRESDEIYILELQETGADNAEIRNGVLDIERLHETGICSTSPA